MRIKTFTVYLASVPPGGWVKDNDDLALAKIIKRGIEKNLHGHEELLEIIVEPRENEL